MNQVQTTANVLPMSNAIEAALMQGDLSKLSSEQKLGYYRSLCSSLGLNPLTAPFEFMNLKGKLVLYAKKGCAEQLRRNHGVSVTITSRETIGDVYVVTARAKDRSGREDESTGAVAITGLKGEDLANAYLKAETKAKRRVTLSMFGLGMMDESEVETIPGAQKAARVNDEIQQSLVVAPTEYPTGEEFANGPAEVVEDRVYVPYTQPEQTIAQPGAAEAPFCCGKEMMVSKYVDKQLGHAPWYCPMCKAKTPRAV